MLKIYESFTWFFGVEMDGRRQFTFGEPLQASSMAEIAMVDPKVVSCTKVWFCQRLRIDNSRIAFLRSKSWCHRFQRPWSFRDHGVKEAINTHRNKFDRERSQQAKCDGVCRFRAGKGTGGHRGAGGGAVTISVGIAC